MNKEFNNYWGIDVSKNWLDVAINNQVIRVDQTEKAIKKFIEDHKNKNILAVLESTGGYELLMVKCLSDSGITVHIAHPNKVKAFSKAKGQLAKTDKLDAKLLKEYGSFINPEEIRALPSQAQYELQMLGARLEQLKEVHHQESCRLGIACEKIIKKSIKKMLNVIEKQMELIEENIMNMINADEGLKEKFKLLRSMKGVGPVLAMTLITDLPELGHANKKEIAALVGVAPITKQSGQKSGKSMIRYGRHGVRKILFMGALTACRHNIKFKTFYEKLIAAGKPKKVAIVAIMRKMIVILNSMVQAKSYFHA